MAMHSKDRAIFNHHVGLARSACHLGTYHANTGNKDRAAVWWKRGHEHIETARAIRACSQ